jgi:hypothetical protein
VHSKNCHLDNCSYEGFSHKFMYTISFILVSFPPSLTHSLTHSLKKIIFFSFFSFLLSFYLLAVFMLAYFYERLNRIHIKRERVSERDSEKEENPIDIFSVSNLVCSGERKKKMWVRRRITRFSAEQPPICDEQRFIDNQEVIKIMLFISEINFHFL